MRNVQRERPTVWVNKATRWQPPIPLRRDRLREVAPHVFTRVARPGPDFVHGYLLNDWRRVDVPRGYGAERFQIWRGRSERVQ